MQGRLAVNRDHIDECRSKARLIAEQLHQLSERHSTLAIEQAVLRAAGAAGTAHSPIITAIAHKLGSQAMKLGVAGWLGRVMIARKLSPEKAAEYMAKHGLGKRDEIDAVSWNQAQRVVRDLVDKWARFIPKKQEATARNGHFRTATSISTGSVGHDLSQLKEWRAKCDLAIVTLPHTAPSDGMPMERRGFLRRKGYSLLDAMRKGMHFSGASDICWQGDLGPESAIAACVLPHMRLAVDPMARMHRDHMDPRKAFIEHGFMLRFSIKTGIGLVSDHRHWKADHIFPLQIILEQWLIQSHGVLDRQSMVLSPLASGKAIPDVVHGLARNQLYREFFPQAELWQSLNAQNPTWDAGVAMVSGLTGAVVPAQNAQVLSAMKEWGAALKPLAYECHFSDHGQLSRSMHTMLERAMKELHRIHRSNAVLTVAEGKVGVESVFEKDRRYWNPLDDFLRS